MDPHRFDALARALSHPGSRRHTLAALIGSAFGLGALASPESVDEVDAKKNKKKRRKRRRKKVRGPCAPGKSKKNSCKKNKQCCTGICKKRKKSPWGRCRCRGQNQPCAKDRNCCSGMSCLDDTCQPATVCAEVCLGGCCAGGTCVSGDTSEACGTDGGPCQDCGGQATCEAGTCQPIPCADRCDGCCNGDTCEPGDSVTACGTGGGICQDCGAQAICEAGICQTEANCADTCGGGCCVGDECATGDSPTACGSDGAACQICSEQQNCQDGSCQPKPCAEICGTGCCAGEICQPGNTHDACGINGETCEPCGTNAICEAGACITCDVCASGCEFTSLQAAIDDASPDDSIRLCPGTYAGTITINKNLSLRGVGRGTNGTILDGEGVGPVVLVTAGVVNLKGLHITGGFDDSGAGIHNEGTLTLTDCAVIQNEAHSAGLGGGIYNDEQGTLTLNNDCEVKNNTAASDGGGIYNNGGVVTLDTSVVLENEAASDGGGIYNAGTLNLTSTDVQSNEAASDGGGIYNDDSLTMTGSKAILNTALNGTGGGIYNAGTISLNQVNSFSPNTPDDCVDAQGGTGCP